MKLSELRTLIKSLQILSQKGEVFLRGEIDGMELSDAAKTSLEAELISHKNAAIDAAALLNKDVLELELDPVPPVLE